MFPLNNREIAALILLGAMLLIALIHERVRESLGKLLLMSLRPQIWIPVVLMWAWVVFEVWVGAMFTLWNFELLKGTVLWTICSGGVLIFNYTNFHSAIPFFWKTVKATFAVVVFVEFIVNLYAMNLIAELTLQLAGCFSVILVTLGGLKPEYARVKKFFQIVLGLIGLIFLTYSVWQISTNWHEQNLEHLMIQFLLPIWLTVGLIPFLYGFSIVVVYDLVFRFIDREPGDWRAYWRHRIALFSTLWFRTRLVKNFTVYWTNKLSETSTYSAATGVIQEFLADQEHVQQTRLEHEERLRRYAGSQDLDNTGRRLDRREFAATISALYRIANCQSGWYRHDECYRDDMLKILNNDFTREGLPQESGITMHVDRDKQSWYAWRRTITGWCFAIGTCSPPPEVWEFDGPEPPNGFPGKDPAWGNEPFADQVNPNWR